MEVYIPHLIHFQAHLRLFLINVQTRNKTFGEAGAAAPNEFTHIGNPHSTPPLPKEEQFQRKAWAALSSLLRRQTLLT